eukprot:CAMPEP_0174312556 /NCGR_PEP_ID=MMETSP0810-20121108/4362_1 /TAXON_ID=73025 ORGANISM="Eutreptiella gymnastica-like, Strain CCMP1594" /NCGR_SAMPLE_ID=MMETSP0810 /ASSEMBLY_ACC=CAM_ASM_000659 /LENGTH=79 /DNA_ID=CAMNT_0015420975 /DNA_START=976 /DNA_END=1212 /DNA_ORIENTATION=-
MISGAKSEEQPLPTTAQHCLATADCRPKEDQWCVGIFADAYGISVVHLRTWGNQKWDGELTFKRNSWTGAVDWCSALDW